MLYNTLTVDHFPADEVACYAEALALVRSGMRFVIEPTIVSSSTGVMPQMHAICREDIVQWVGEDVRANSHIYGAFVARVAPVIGKKDSFAVPADEVAAAFADYRYELRRSFQSLFHQFRQGVSLLPSDELRRLAAAAALTRGEQINIEAWARRLSDDIAAADD